MIHTCPAGARTTALFTQCWIPLLRSWQTAVISSKIRFTFQEYFKRMTEDPNRWGTPFAALLGAYSAQLGFGLPSIGGKDSMSGTFNDESTEKSMYRRHWFPSQLMLPTTKTHDHSGI